jgi:hypothetical protein
MSPRFSLRRPPPPHDPTERILVTRIDGWLVRDFAEDDQRLAYFAMRGFSHFQLWHPAYSISVLTPSRLTGGAFEVFPIGNWKRRAADWEALDSMLKTYHQVAPPGESCLRALERWFPHLPDSFARAHVRGWSCLITGEEGPGICPACLYEVFRWRGE